MSETDGTTGTRYDLGHSDAAAVEVFPGREDYGSSGTSAGTEPDSTTETAKQEAKATADQAKEGAKHVAQVGREDAKDVVRETSEQAKELWQQTRTQLLDQSAQQQTRVAEGLRSLSEELSGMARSSEQQGVASDLAQQASARMGDVATWLDDRDPGSLVSEVKQFARQRPGTFLAAAAVVGLVGGRLSRGLVADHQDDSTADHSAHDSSAGASSPAAQAPVSGVAAPVSEPTGPAGGSTSPLDGGGASTDELRR